METSNKKRGFVGKLIRFALWGVAGSLFLVVLLVATLPLWISPVATSVAGKVVPEYTGTDFRINRFYFNPYSGSLVISGVKLSNPDGFGEAAAFSLSDFNVEVSVGSIFSDTINVREMAIDDAFVSYYSNDGKNNFDVILANVEKATGPKDEKTGPEVAKEESASSQKKIIIEHLRIAGTKVKLMKSDMMPPLMLPTIDLKDIGKKSNGASFEEAFVQISESVMKSMASIGDGLGALGGLFGDGTKGISGLVNMGAKDMTKKRESASDKTGESQSGVLGATKDVSSGASDAVKKTAAVVGGVAKGTADVVGDAAKGTIDAVGDTTKKAAEGVKKLFKGFGK